MLACLPGVFRQFEYELHTCSPGFFWITLIKRSVYAHSGSFPAL
jgi:hypothetical protein